MMKVGLIINPVAGIGGKVGLKGSDGADTFEKAIELGAFPESGQKALAAIQRLKEAGEEIQLFTCPGKMGEDICKEAGMPAIIVGIFSEDTCKRDSKVCDTTSEDTVQAVRMFRKEGVELILFAGGDGTARDIMDAAGREVTVLGIPTGCKIHSGVYALNPEKAGRLAVEYITGKTKRTKEAEVMDIDEELFRQNIVQAKLYGYLQIPDDMRYVQNLKCGGGPESKKRSLELLADYIADMWEKDTLYIVGTGSTTDAVMKRMGLPNTLLGVDLVWNNSVIASDCTESQILDEIQRHDKVKILVTVIGGQGYLFGRGNQQISAKVLQRVGKDNIIVAAAKDKMTELFGKPLYVDTGDAKVNEMLKGYIRVCVGYGEIMMAKVSD